MEESNGIAKSNKCGLCGKSFSDGTTLKIHIHTIHEGHKDHKCKSCGKSFYQLSNLKTHIHAIHDGQKDHKTRNFTDTHPPHA